MKKKIYPSSKKDWQHNASLHWIVNGKVKETIISNQPYSVCNAKKKELMRTNHYRLGKLVVVSVQAKSQVP